MDIQDTSTGPLGNYKLRYQFSLKYVLITSFKFTLTFSDIIDIMGSPSAMEVCGDLRTSKFFLAVATVSSKESGITFIEFDSDKTRLNHRHPVSRKSLSPYTKLAYSSGQSLLACADEIGVVSLSDFALVEPIAYMVDPSGINDIKFNRIGQMLSVGNSGKLQLWDIRVQFSVIGESSVSSISIDVPRTEVYRYHSKQKAHRREFYTSIIAHPVNDYLVFCGTNIGSVVLWDLRKSDKRLGEFRPHKQSGNCL